MDQTHLMTKFQKGLFALPDVLLPSFTTFTKKTPHPRHGSAYQKACRLIQQCLKDGVDLTVGYDRPEILSMFDSHEQSDKVSALGIAVEFGDAQLVKTLIEHGAQVSPQEFKLWAEALTFHDISPKNQMRWRMKELVEILDVLLPHVNVSDPQWSEWEFLPLTRLLLMQNSDADKSRLDQCMEQIMEHGGKFEVVEDWLASHLHLAPTMIKHVNIQNIKDSKKHLHENLNHTQAMKLDQPGRKL